MKRSRIAVIVIAFILALGWLALGAEAREPEDQMSFEQEGHPPKGPQKVRDGHGKDKSESRWGRGGGSRGGGRGERMQRMQRKHEEYLDWLKENYPQEAQELEKVRQENPELYMRRVMRSGRKYGRIAEAAKDNPELAAVLKEDLELKDERDEIVQKLRSAEDGDKEALTA